MTASIEKLQIELMQAKQQLLDQYYVDQLTNLPNLYCLRRDMEQQDTFTFIVYNIDNFKILNDFYGLVVGDVILESVAKRLKVYFGNAIVYRIASDEFGILLKKRLNFYELKAALQTFTKDLSHISFAYADTEIHVDGTMASAVSTNDNDLFSKVSMALKYAKKGNLSFWIFENDMHVKKAYESNLKFATIIRDALDDSGVTPYFQPIIDLETDRIIKYEALSRLIDSKGMVHSPASFIPITKTIKVYDRVTRTIIQKSFEIFQDSDMDFSINLSFEDIVNPEIYHFIITMLEKTKMGEQVTFELLESEHVTDFKKVIGFFEEVKRYGAKVAIDDFGSGFSNFAYLIKLNPDYIKIDGSLIENIDTDFNAQLVVETIVTFAKKLGIKTIAEYVHSSTVLSAVKTLGIDYAQGYHIDVPSPTIPHF